MENTIGLKREGEIESAAAARQIVASTLRYLAAEIAENLRADSEGVAAVLQLIHALAHETEKGMTSRQVAKASVPVLVVQEARGRHKPTSAVVLH